MHCCQDEVMAIVMLIPFVGFTRSWIVNVWRKRHQKPNCCHGGEDHGKDS